MRNITEYYFFFIQTIIYNYSNIYLIRDRQDNEAHQYDKSSFKMNRFTFEQVKIQICSTRCDFIHIER